MRGTNRRVRRVFCLEVGVGSSLNPQLEHQTPRVRIKRGDGVAVRDGRVARAHRTGAHEPLEHTRKEGRTPAATPWRTSATRDPTPDPTRDPSPQPTRTRTDAALVAATVG